MNTNEIMTIIVDDEPTCIKSLANDLSRFSDIHIVVTCTSPDNAAREIVRLQPDLLFLDVDARYVWPGTFKPYSIRYSFRYACRFLYSL